MTPQLLAETGRLLFGRDWQRRMAESVGYNRATIARWAAGDFQVPDHVQRKLASLAAERGEEIARLTRALATGE